jgi:hypothetical protein
VTKEGLTKGNEDFRNSLVKAARNRKKVLGTPTATPIASQQPVCQSSTLCSMDRMAEYHRVCTSKGSSPISAIIEGSASGMQHAGNSALWRKRICWSCALIICTFANCMEGHACIGV